MKPSRERTTSTGVSGFSVIVPVHDEATLIASTARTLVASLPDGLADVVYVCNGCSDATAEILRRVVDDRVQVLETPHADKAAAIRAGEMLTRRLPRFYVDGDVRIRGKDLVALAHHLEGGESDLVSPRIVLDLRGASPVARALHTFAQSLPHAQTGAFHGVLGVSVAGRARWGEFPDVIADDTFIEANIETGRKSIVTDVVVIVTPPLDLASSIRVRARWLRGVRELRRLGMTVPRSSRQRRELLQAMVTRRRSMSAVLYVAVRASAVVVCLHHERRNTRWVRDASSRRLPPD